MEKKHQKEIKHLQERLDTKNDGTPTFYAFVNSDRTIAANSIVTFDNTIHNEGGYFNPQSHAFTCQEEGLYFFSWCIEFGVMDSMSGHVLTSIELRKNGVTVVARGPVGNHDFHNNNSYGSGSTSSSAVVFCSAGEQVAVYVSNARTAIVNGQFSSFTGFRLSSSDN